MKTIQISKQDLERLYFVEQKDMREIAKIYSCSWGTIRNHMLKYGLSPRSKSEAFAIRNQLPHKSRARIGASNGNYRHGLYVQERIYRKMLAKESCAWCGSREYLDIHHKNHDHYDNHPENLEVVCHSCHASYHKSLYWKRQRGEL